MKKKILIVEDDQSIANLQKDYLVLSGFSVKIVNSGTDGLKALEEETFDSSFWILCCRGWMDSRF